MTTPSAAELLKVQLRSGWLNARRTLEGLTDDEYWWEPVEGCWSVRRRADATRGWGRGDIVCEDAWPPPDPLPVTTIAWRVIHLAAWTDVYRGFAFEGTRPDLMDFEIPGDMAAGMAWLIDAQDRLLARLDELDDAGVFEPRPAHWGESVPVVRLATALLTEHVHHLAEVGALRDLRRGHAVSPPPPAEHPAPAWWSGPDG